MASSLLSLLQLASPALPVGAFSYSEGLETLVQHQQITGVDELEHWLEQELRYGAIRVEASVLIHAYDCVLAGDLDTLQYWNHWLSAFRETEEFREQSWQMGRALTRLLPELDIALREPLDACGERCNFAIAFAIAATHWQIDRPSTLAGYLHSWASNLIGAGIKLVPLGQTQGQQLLMRLHPLLDETADMILANPTEGECNCGWGLAIASMTHETLYSRLFRS